MSYTCSHNFYIDCTLYYYYTIVYSIGNGSWITAGITTNDIMIQNTIDGSLTTITCKSTHLTSFAVLVDVVGGLEVNLLSSSLIIAV